MVFWVCVCLGYSGCPVEPSSYGGGYVMALVPAGFHWGTRGHCGPLLFFLPPPGTAAADYT